MRTLYAFLQAHPAYAHFDLYLTGQSYAGVYIPLVANLITRLDGPVAEVMAKNLKVKEPQRKIGGLKQLTALVFVRMFVSSVK